MQDRVRRSMRNCVTFGRLSRSSRSCTSGAPLSACISRSRRSAGMCSSSRPASTRRCSNAPLDTSDSLRPGTRCPSLRRTSTAADGLALARPGGGVAAADAGREIGRTVLRRGRLRRRRHRYRPAPPSTPRVDRAKSRRIEPQTHRPDRRHDCRAREPDNAGPPHPGVGTLEHGSAEGGPQASASAW